MPNYWCFTNYRVVGDHNSLVDLRNKIDYVCDRRESLIKNELGPYWCGNLVNYLGGDWYNVGCRGTILHNSLDTKNGPENLIINVESAWHELYEWRKFIEEKYSDIKFYYFSEGPRFSNYKTNDVEGIYFPQRYVLFYNMTTNYYNNSNVEDLFTIIYSITKMKVDSVEKIEEVLSRYNELHKIEYKHYSTNIFFNIVNVVDNG
jgi:hypothetical protein